MGSNLRWNPLFCEFHRQEDHPILTIKIQPISPFGTNRRRRSIIIMKYAQSTLHKKGLLSRGKDFIRVLAQQRERHCSHQTMLEPSCFAKVRELCKATWRWLFRDTGPLKDWGPVIKPQDAQPPSDLASTIGLQYWQWITAARHRLSTRQVQNWEGRQKQ